MTAGTTPLFVITTDDVLRVQLSEMLGLAWQVTPATSITEAHLHLLDLREHIPPDLAAAAEQAPIVGLVHDPAGAVAVLQAGVHEALTTAELLPLCLMRALTAAQIRWQIEYRRRQQLAEARAQVQALTVRLQNEQIRDPLTGLYTRRYLQETLERELRRADREQIVLSVALIDIDQLEQVNWQFGRALGDVTIQHVAA